MNWIKEIAIAQYVNEKIRERDTDSVWLFSFPDVAADTSQIEEFRKSQRTVPIVFLDFLSCANGWSNFYQAVRILGTNDFGGPLESRAQKLISTLDLDGFIGRELIPVAVSTNDIDVFFMERQGEKVFWYAGQPVDDFASFAEWFLAMVDYNRLEYERLKKD